MFRILDRYLIREIVVPFAIALLVLTFLLMVQPIIQRGESFIAKGVEFTIVARALWALVPAALSLTIPMSVLMGILVGFGRLSADREFVAFHACGVSLLRLLRPVMLVAGVAAAATAYQLIEALPRENKRFQEIAAQVMIDRIDHEVTPRVFFEEFRERVIYVRELPPDGGWREVFVADTSRPGERTVFVAREGRIRLNRELRQVHLELTDGSSHRTSVGRPEVYERTEFERIVINLESDRVFRDSLPRGAPEMTMAELRTAIADADARGGTANYERFMLQYKLSLPMSCPVLALIALGLGASSRKGGRLGSFVLGTGVILVYYVLFYGLRSMALGGRLQPEWAPWIPNIVLGIAGVMLVAWRARSADKPVRISLPAFWRRPRHPGETTGPAAAAGRRRVVVVIRVPHLTLPTPRLLDMYVSREYMRVFMLGVVALLGLFYISTFIDLADKMLRGEATGTMLARFLFFQTPQFVHYIIPMAVLLSTLVTIGVMTKNSELLVMRACGISLYRVAAPLLVFALAAGGVLFELQERVLAKTSREADRLERLIRGWPPRRSPLDRRWRVSEAGDIFNYEGFDASASRFDRLWLYTLDEPSWTLRTMTFVSEATLAPEPEGSDGVSTAWRGANGWRRDVSPRVGVPGAREPSPAYAPVSTLMLPLGPPGDFTTDLPAAEQMTLGELRGTSAGSRGAAPMPFRRRSACTARSPSPS